MRHKRFILLILSCLILAPPVMAQDEMPMVVDPSRGSRKTFVNGEEIKITYTLRWLDGYQPQLDQANPENMSFGLELDPVKGHKRIEKNRRKYKNSQNISDPGENYVDLVYYLIHVGPEKGEIKIPEQTFYYKKLEPGKSEESLELKPVRSAPMVLRYDSVLTKDADDIMDIVDFGSFKQQEKLWKGFSLAGFFISVCAIFWLVYRNPASGIGKNKSKKNKNGGGIIIDGGNKIPDPETARLVFLKEIEQLQNDAAQGVETEKTIEKTIMQLANALRQLLLAYVPESLESDTTEELMQKFQENVPFGRLRELVCWLIATLQSLERTIYSKRYSDFLKPNQNATFTNCRNVAVNIKKSKIKSFERKAWLYYYWYKLKTTVGVRSKI